MYTYIHTYIHSYVYVKVYVYVYVNVHVHVYVCICLCIYIQAGELEELLQPLQLCCSSVALNTDALRVLDVAALLQPLQLCCSSVALNTDALMYMYIYTGGRTGETEERGPRGARPPAGLLALLVQK